METGMYRVTGPQNTASETWWFCLTLPDQMPSNQPDRWVTFPAGQNNFIISVDQDGLPLLVGNTYNVNARLDPTSGINDDTEPVSIDAAPDIAPDPIRPGAKRPIYGSYTIDAPSVEELTFFALVPAGTEPRAEDGAWIPYPPGGEPVKATYGQNGQPLRFGDAYRLYWTTNQVTLENLGYQVIELSPEGGEVDPVIRGCIIAGWLMTHLGIRPEFLLTTGRKPVAEDVWSSDGTDYFTFFEEADQDELVPGKIYTVFRRSAGVQSGADYEDAYRIQHNPAGIPKRGDTLHSVMLRGRYTTLEGIMAGLSLSKSGQVGLTLLNELFKPLATFAADGLYDEVKNPNGGKVWMQNESSGGYFRLLRDLRAVLLGSLEVSILPHMPEGDKIIVAKTVGGFERFGYQTREEVAANIVDYLPESADESEILPAEILAIGISYDVVTKEGTLWVRTKNAIRGAMLWVEDPTGLIELYGLGWEADKWLATDYEALIANPNGLWNSLLRVNAEPGSEAYALQPGQTIRVKGKILGSNKVFSKLFTMPTESTTVIQIIAEQDGSTDPEPEPQPAESLWLFNDADAGSFGIRGLGWLKPISGVEFLLEAVGDGASVPESLQGWKAAANMETDSTVGGGVRPALSPYKRTVGTTVQYKWTYYYGFSLTDGTYRLSARHGGDVIATQLVSIPITPDYENNYNSLNDPRGAGGDLSQFDMGKTNPLP